MDGQSDPKPVMQEVARTASAAVFAPAARGPTRDFGFLPIPKKLQYDPAMPFPFTGLLNGVFAAGGKRISLACGTLCDENAGSSCVLRIAVTATFTVANLYYNQPILVEMAAYFDVPYNKVTRCATMVQIGYLTGLLFVGPIADIVPRRPFLLFIVFMGGVFTLGLGACSNFNGFLVLSYIVGIFTVTPQVLNPLAADLAPPHKRAAAISIVVTGLVSGMMFGRVASGVITKYVSFKNVYWMAAGLQFAMTALLWAVLPWYPRKQKDITYPKILWSMVYMFFTEPLLTQACLIGFFSCCIFVGWWTSLTFLLSEPPFNYQQFEIGLFGLCGLGSIVLAAQLGRLNDRLTPWLGSLCGLLLQLSVACISVGASGISLAAVIIVCIFTDVAQQAQQIGNQTRIYTIDPLARGRLNGTYMAFVFLGQTFGSSAGARVFLQYAATVLSASRLVCVLTSSARLRFGWRACYGMSVGLSCAAIFVLCLRGPRCKGWVGWGGDYRLMMDRPPSGKTKALEDGEGMKVVVQTAATERVETNRGRGYEDDVSGCETAVEQDAVTVTDEGKKEDVEKEKEKGGGEDVEKESVKEALPASVL